jgi:hypothetical protein
MGDGGGEFNVTHALPTNLGASYLYPAALTNNSLEAHALVFSAIALPVTSRSEDLLAEQAIFLWLESAVVDGLWLLDFTV